MNWKIKLENLSQGGFAPAYWKETYPAIGNKNQAADIVSCDLTNPSYITQGPGLSAVSGTVDQTMKGILNTVVSANKTYGFGGTKLYDITASAVVVERTVAGAAGEDVALYDGHLKYVYGTDVGDFDLSTTYDDDWWTAVAGGSALTSGNPHQIVTAGTTGLMTILNGSVVASWDGTTADDTAFDTEDTDIVLVSQVWTRNKFYFAGNKPNVAGRNEASIFIWDGTSSSWNNRIEIGGRVGGMFVKGGVPFIFYQKNISDGVITLAYCDGNILRDITNYEGSLPNFYQITEYKDHIIWASGTDLFAWGSSDQQLNTKIFKLGTCGTGGLANPFGTPITASSDKLQKLNAYTKVCNWKSLLFDVTGGERKSVIDKLKFNIEKIATGARLDWTLKNNAGTSINTGTISFTGDGAITSKDFFMKKITENFRIELNWANGSEANPVSVKTIEINGHTV